MDLRQRKYPKHFWFELNTFSVDPSSLLPLVKHRTPKPKRIIGCLAPLAPHVQRLIYQGAIDKRKGEIRTGKYPISSEQFSLIRRLGGSNRYTAITELEQGFDLQYEFLHKGYVRRSTHVQFRLQELKPVIEGKKSAFFLFIRFQQKPPEISQ